MIKSSKHTIKFANTNKQKLLNSFLDEYQKAVIFYVKNLWYKKHKVVDKQGNTHILNIQNNQLTTLAFNPDKSSPRTNLLSRALKCAKTQALGMVNSRITDQAKRIYVLKQKQKQGKLSEYKHLQQKIDKTNIKIPYLKNINAELNSICAVFKKSDGLFDGYIQLSSIGKIYGKIRIPIKFTKQSNKFNNLMKSFLIKRNSIDLRWKIPKKEKGKGTIEGADQGIVTCLTFSDGQTTKKNNHGFDLNLIIKKLSKKKKGSKSFKRTQDHRKNYINWSLNQLDLSSIKELRFEGLTNVGKGQRKCRFLSHFSYSLIKDKMENICIENGVRFITTEPTYRSQRCNECGYVHKSNRKGKTFKCLSCGHMTDADLNAACNNRDNLIPIPFGFRKLKLNLEGFYWLKTGLFDCNNKPFTVACEKQKV